MENYASNSHKSRNAEKKSLEEKKVEKVIAGSARKKKRTGIQKIADLFIADDITNIGDYLVQDILVPIIKKSISEGIEMLLYGYTGKSNNTAARTPYRSCFNNSNNRKEPNSSRNGTGYDYDSILFNTIFELDA